MEDNKKTWFDFLGQSLIAFAVNIIVLMIFVMAWGEHAKHISSIYQLGKEGLSIETMGQFLLISLLITGIRWFFFSGRIIRKMSTLCRVFLMLLIIFSVTVICIYIFDWFQINDSTAWISFILCFFGGASLGTIIALIKTKMENRIYQKMFAAYKEKEREEKENQ